MENNIEEVKIEQPKPNEEAKKGVSLFFGITALLGTRMGAGIVGVPYVSKNMGYTFIV